jgi:hypothetical protein
LGSFDRHVHPDQPGRPDRRDAAASRPGAPRETEAQWAERLGLSTLTRAAAYESLHAETHTQDAPFRDRLAREGRGGKRESLSEPDGSRQTQDPPKPPADKPENAPETPGNYWTEVPRFLALWRDHVERWPWTQRLKTDRPMAAEQRAEAAGTVREIFQAEQAISGNVKDIEGSNAKPRSTGQLGWFRACQM